MACPALLRFGKCTDEFCLYAHSAEALHRFAAMAQTERHSQPAQASPYLDTLSQDSALHNESRLTSRPMDAMASSTVLESMPDQSMSAQLELMALKRNGMYRDLGDWALHPGAREPIKAHWALTAEM